MRRNGPVPRLPGKGEPQARTRRYFDAAILDLQSFFEHRLKHMKMLDPRLCRESGGQVNVQFHHPMRGDGDARARMGAAGRAKVEADFTATVEASRLARLYRAGDKLPEGKRPEAET